MEVAARDVTPPIIQVPTVKEKKYDRQLRLWAASGQRAVEESHVLLVVGESGAGSNSSVAGAETLKNLVLPGVGNFTIADAAVVSEADLAINFFLEPSSLGKSRAEETKRLLLELNPDVTGNAISVPLSQWISQPDCLQRYNLIIACAPVASEILERLSIYASHSNIPLIEIKSVGLFSYLSIQLPSEFPIVDTHPDPETTADLRILDPWPELSAEIDALHDMAKLSDHDHGHIPYLLILLYYAREWHEEHGTYPSNFKEKTAFRDLVRSGARTANPEGGEENFDEACAAVLKTISPAPVGSGIKEVFAMQSCQSLTIDSANFWIIANAIKVFYEKHAVLPLPGSLPDMKATSEGYIKLQNVYRAKARADAAEVTDAVRYLEQSLGRRTSIRDEEIERFCKNASHVRVLTNPSHLPLPSLRLEKLDQKVIAAVKTALDNDWEEMVPVFIALHASSVAKFPSRLSEDDEKTDLISKYTQEVERMKGGELHNISSVTGGIVAQEAIKLMTKQYVPVDGTAVYDGIRAKLSVFKL